MIDEWPTLAIFPASFDAGGVAAVWRQEESEAEQVLSKLVAAGLLGLDLASLEQGHTRFILKPEKRSVAAQHLVGIDLAAARKRHSIHYLEVLRELARCMNRGEHSLSKALQLIDLELPNFQQGQEWASANAMNDLEAAKVCSEYPRAAPYLLTECLPATDRIRWLQAALAAARCLKDQEAEVVHLTTLGAAYLNGADIQQSIHYSRKGLEISRKLGRRTGEGACLVSLGRACMNLGNLQEAIEWFQQAILIGQEIRDRNLESVSLDNLGLVFMDLGDLKRAQRLCGRAANIAASTGDLLGLRKSERHLAVIARKIDRLSGTTL